MTGLEKTSIYVLAWRDLLLCAKHLFFAAIPGRRAHYCFHALNASANARSPEVPFSTAMMARRPLPYTTGMSSQDRSVSSSRLRFALLSSIESPSRKEVDVTLTAEPDSGCAPARQIRLLHQDSGHAVDAAEGKIDGQREHHFDGMGCRQRLVRAAAKISHGEFALRYLNVGSDGEIGR